MPKLDGIQACASIKSADHKVPIFALTANVMSGDRDKYATLGFSACISKPIDIKALYQQLASVLIQH